MVLFVVFFGAWLLPGHTSLFLDMLGSKFQGSDWCFVSEKVEYLVSFKYLIL